MLDPEDPNIRPVGGGTAVIQMMKVGVLRPTRLVFLDRVESHHSDICVDAIGQLHLGGLASLSTIEHSSAVKSGWPMLALALVSLSNVRVRNVATLGGSLAHGDPHMDLPPILCALGAHALVSGPFGDRTVLIEDLYLGYYDTVLARNELIVKVVVPPQNRLQGAYSKVTTRSHHDWPALGLAAVLSQTLDGRLESVSLVVGAATDRPTRLVSAEKMLQGSMAEDHLLREAGALAAAELEIVGDSHGSAEYKKQLLRTYLGRTVKQALGTVHQGATK